MCCAINSFLWNVVERSGGNFFIEGVFKMEKNDEFTQDIDEVIQDINGIKKRSAIAILNKEHLSKYELDELFA